MNFTSLSSAWLFALLVPLIVFYFLKLKRPRQTVSSLVLWRQVLSDQRVNSPFQRFKRNLLLILQILLLALLVLAAMQPFLRRESQRTDRLPILIDVSASMGALDREGGKSRLEEAKARLRERISALSPDQDLCLIAFSKSARRLTGFTSNQTELREAVNSLEIEDVPGELEEGLRLAQALARTTPFERVLVMTDGNLPAKANFELPFQLDLQKLPPAGPNAGITACNARRTAAGDWEVFVQLAVTDPPPSNTATLTLHADGQQFPPEQVALTGGGAPRLTFRVSGTQNALLQASLRPAGFDALASDNDAWLTLPAVRQVDVFVPESLPAFRHALAMQDGVRVFPAKDLPSPGSFDLAIVEDGKPPVARVICTVGQIPPDLKDLVAMEKKSIGAIDWRRESPILQHVGLEEVVFLDDPVLAAGKDESALTQLGYQVLIQGPHGPLAVQHTEGVEIVGQARIHCFFHPDRSTLPFRVAFPIFASNLVIYAQKLAGLSEATAAPTGVLPPQSYSPGTTVTMTGPGKISRKEQADVRGVLTGLSAPRVGEYRLSAGSDERRMGASLLSTMETSLVAVKEVEFDERIAIKVDNVAPKADRSLWWMLAVIGFGVLLLEWWWFQRRPV